MAGTDELLPVSTPVGDRTPSGGVASRLDDRVVGALRDAGLDAITGTIARTPDLNTPSGNTSLSEPDAIVGSVCIEVDSLADRGRGTTHLRGSSAHDLFQDDCVRAAGYRVVRRRLGGLEPAPDTTSIVKHAGPMTAVTTPQLVEATRHASGSRVFLGGPLACTLLDGSRPCDAGTDDYDNTVGAIWVPADDELDTSKRRLSPALYRSSGRALF